MMIYEELTRIYAGKEVDWVKKISEKNRSINQY